MKKIKKSVSLLIIFCTIVTLLSGCRWLFSESISFTKSQINMVYGQTVDLSDYIKIEGDGGGVYTLSSNSDIISVVSNSAVKAVGTGTAKVTATLASGQGSASVTLSIAYADAESITIYTVGELYQRLPAKNVTFNAAYNDGVDPSTKINWFVDGVKQDTESYQFTFKPINTSATYVIKASHTRLSEIYYEKTLRIYNDYDAACFTYEGDTEFEEPTSIYFDIESDTQKNNPDYLLQMFVNDKLIKEHHGFNHRFDFLPPSAGIYTFTFKLNGETILDKDGLDFVEICFKGIVTPTGLRLDFDNDYPKIYLCWDNNDDTLFTVEVIRKSDNDTKTLIDINANEGKADIGGFIDLTKNYIIKVKSQDHGIFLESEFVVLEHAAIDQNAISYLSKRYLNKNFYMTDEDEIFEVFDYMMTFRPDASESNKKITSSCTAYMGFTSRLSISYFLTKFSDRLTITGSYSFSIIGTLSKGKAIKISIIFYSENQPTNFDTTLKEPHKMLIAPKLSDIGYDDYLAVENYPLSSSEVQNTNELFYTLEYGLKPRLKKNSTAEKYYNQAREILYKIIDTSMTQEEIARAIYDFVMYSVSYDDQVVKNSKIDYAVVQPAYYVEGVLKTGFAVCDGIAKTYSLLCNMAGLRCIRVVGKAGAQGIDHAWNKVLIDKDWYIVDATWGNTRTTISGKYYKLGTHGYFLLSDTETKDTHFEMPLDYPKTAPMGFNWFLKQGDYIYDSLDLNTQLKELSLKIIKLYNSLNSKDFVVMDDILQSEYFTYEFKVASALSSAFEYGNNTLKDLLKSSLRFSESEYVYRAVDDVVIVGIK